MKNLNKLSKQELTDHKNAEKELEKYHKNLEELVKVKTKKYRMEKLNSLFVDREFRIKELKNKIEELQ